MPATSSHIHQAFLAALSPEHGELLPGWSDLIAEALASSGERPTDEEIDLLVYGGPEGETSEEMENKFPALAALIEGFAF